MVEQHRRFGATDEQAEGWCRQHGLTDNKDEPDVVEVLSDNWDTVMWFMACDKQWDFNPMSGRLNKLPLTEVRAAAELVGLSKKAWRERFPGLKLMIDEVLRVVRTEK
ncbi:MAG: DUF1799 domain-containing protein [Arenicellales bacterium]